MASLSTCHLGLWLGWQILLNLERCHAPFDGREGEGSEKKRGRERRQRGREICRLFVNADMYKCLAIFNMAMVRTTL